MFCIRPGVNACDTCIRTERKFSKICLCIGTGGVNTDTMSTQREGGKGANTYSKINFSIIFYCSRASANTGPPPRMHSHKYSFLKQSFDLHVLVMCRGVLC